MDESKKQRRADTLLILSGWLLLTIGSLGRYVYSTVLPELIADKGFTNTEAGLVSSFMFFSYAIVQTVFLNGFRKFPARLVLSFGTLASAGICFAMPFCGAKAMTALAIFNGISTAFIYMMVVEMFALYLSPARLATASMLISTGLSATRLILYGLAAIGTNFLNWKWAFFFSGALMAIVAVYWFFYAKRFPKHLADSDGERQGGTVSLPKGKWKYAPFLVVFGVNILGGVAFGFVRRVIDAWFPVILEQDFKKSPSLIYALMLAVVLIAMAASFLSRLFIRATKNYSLLQAILYGVVGILAAVIAVWMNEGTFLSFLFLTFAALLFSYCVSSVAAGYLPMQCRSYMSSGTFFAAVNAAGCVGICVADYGIGSSLDNRPWQFVFFLIAGVAVLLTVAMAVAAVSTKKLNIDRTGNKN